MDDPFVELVTTRWKKAEDLYNPFLRRTRRYYDAYRGIYTGRFQPHRNNINIPFIFSVVQSDVSRKVQTSFTSKPFVEFDAAIPEARTFAAKVESLVTQQFLDDDIMLKAYDVYLGGDLYGTSVGKVLWRQEVRRTIRDMPVAGPQGPMMSPQEFDIIHYDGPTVKVLDLQDFMITPGFRTIKEAPWVVERYYLDMDQIFDLASAGVFDLEAVQFLAMDNNEKGKADFKSRRSIYQQFDDFHGRKWDDYAKPICVKEMWGRVPYELAPDGMIERVITVANDKVVLRNRANPLYHGLKPYFSYSPMPDPHYFHAPGKVEIAEKLQYTANRYANQKLDALDLVIDPVWIYNRQVNLDPAGLRTKAGANIGIDGPVDDTTIRPLSPDLRGLQLAWTEIQAQWNYMQQGTGIVEDTVQGGPPASSRQTAREFMGRQENVMTRLMLESRLAEVQFVEPVANMFHSLNQQYCPLPKQVRLLGSSAIFDQQSGFPVFEPMIDITTFDLVHDYRARAVGSTRMLGRMVKQQDAQVIHQMIASHPVGMMMVNWGAWFRNIFELFDHDSQRYMMQAPSIMNMVGLGAMNGAFQPDPAAKEPSGKS